MSDTNITIEASTEEVKKRVGDLANQYGKVMTRALNRAMTTGAKVLKQETAKRYYVRQKDVDAVLRRKKATYEDLTARLTYTDTHRNLYWFGRADAATLSPRHVIRSSDPYDPDPKNVFARVMTGHAKVALDDRPKPFVQRAARSGNIGLFVRANNASRAPLRGVGAPALPQIVRNENVLERFERETRDTLQKRVEHEITRMLEGHST